MDVPSRRDTVRRVAMSKFCVWKILGPGHADALADEIEKALVERETFIERQEEAKATAEERRSRKLAERMEPDSTPST